MRANDAHEMVAFDDAGAPAGVLRMASHLLAGVLHPHLALGHDDGDRLADELPRHAVAVGVELDAGAGVDAAAELTHLQERRLGRERRKCSSFVAFEAVDRWLGGGAVHPHVGDLAHPASKMRLQFFQGCEAMTGNGIALDVAHAALVLALGPGAVWGTRPGDHAPVAAEGVEAVVEGDLAGLRVVLVDERPRVVDQHLAGGAAEVPERAFQALQPSGLALVQEHGHVGPA
jgi:hypothetical protein